MEKNNQNLLQKLTQILNVDKIISPEDIQAIRDALIGVLANNKKELESLTEETKQAVNSILDKVLNEHDTYLEKTKQIAQEAKSETTEAINSTLKSLEEVKALCKEVMECKPENGEDADEEYVIGEVLNRIKLPEYKEIVLDDGSAIVDKINSLPVNEENQIDAKHIKNLPEGKGGRVISGGVTRKIVEQMIAASGAGGTPGGSDTQVQFNDGGSFGGISGATTDGTAVTYTANNLKAADITASGSGGFLIQSNSGTDVGLFGAGGGAGATFYGGVNISGELTVDTNTLYVDATNNKVGIGTTTPQSKLDVSGGIGIAYTGSTIADMGSGLFIGASQAVANRFGLGVSGGLYFQGGAGNDNFDFRAKTADGSLGTVNVRIQDNGNVGIGTTAPTHSLTLKSTSTGIALYNTADQTTNYERGEFLWSGNEYVLRTLNGGTGTSRPIKVAARNSSGNQTSLTLTRVSAPFSLLTHDSTGTTGKINQVTGTSASSSSTYNFYCIEPTINQSSTAGYTALLVNPTETTIGNGTKLLADFQVGGTSRLRVDNLGNQTISSAATSGLRLYNTADETTNTEYAQTYWTGGEYVTALLAGGTGINRTFKWTSSSTTRTMTFGSNAVGTPVFSINGASTGITAGMAVITASLSGASALFVSLTPTFTASSGTSSALSITPTYNQSSTAGATDLLINRTQTVVGSGAQLLADFQVGGSSKLSIANTGFTTITGTPGSSTTYTGLLIQNTSSGIGADAIISMRAASISTGRAEIRAVAPGGSDTELAFYTSDNNAAATEKVRINAVGTTTITNATDSASNQVLVLQGDRATPANNDDIYISFKLSDSAGNQDEFGRIGVQASDVTSGSEDGIMQFRLAVAGSLTQIVNLTSARLAPATNDGNALGTSTQSWSDLFLASGGVINWNNGNATLTHSTGLLTSNVPIVAPKRVVTTTDDSTAVIDVALTDVYQLTAIANNTTFSFTGTPTDGQNFIIRYKDAGVSKTLTWTGFTAIGVTLPTATTAGKWGYVGVTYNSAAAAYHVTAVTTEA